MKIKINQGDEPKKEEFNEVLDFCMKRLESIIADPKVPAHIILVVTESELQGADITTSIRSTGALALNLLDFLLDRFPQDVVDNAIAYRAIKNAPPTTETIQ